MNTSLFLKNILQTISFGHFVYRIPSKNNVYLTFDDGPHPLYTQKILSILETYDVKATFFLIGENVIKYPNIVKQINTSGHTIGLHTFTHQDIDQMNWLQFTKEIEKNQEAIHQSVNFRPQILRPPRGKLSISSILKSFVKGIKIIHFTVTSNDWKYSSTEEILDQVNIDSIHSGDIISFHDTNEITCSAIENLIPGILGKGLKFDKV